MKSKHLRFGKDFHVVLQNRRSQAAQMVLRPGEAEGDSENFHRGSDQWLFVVEGKGIAIIDGQRIELRKGSLLLIEKGDKHKIKASGRSSLKTLNFYVPPAYTLSGDPLPPGRGKRKKLSGF